MDSVLLSMTLVEAEPYLIGFAAGFIAHRFYLPNRWRFKLKLPKGDA